jgi:hypothetical protein
MPIKAEVTTEDALSFNSSELNLKGGGGEVEVESAGGSSSTVNTIASSASTIKSSQIPTKINPVKDKSAAEKSNESKFRFDGGEQQIIVACRLRPLTEEEIIEGL